MRATTLWNTIPLAVALIMACFFMAATDKPQPLVPQDDPRAAKDFVYVNGAYFYLHGEPYEFKGMNYFPSRNCWRLMWERWDPHVINNELALLENIGVNTVRVFLDYRLFEQNRPYGDNSIMLARLDELLGLCDSHGMRALVTPFVWGRSNIARDRAHIRHIAERFKDDPRIFGWDISNELDHGWHAAPKTRIETQQWAEAIFSELKSIDGNHPVTVGDYGHYLGDRSDPYGSGISLDLSKMSVPLQYQDFVCLHWYEHPLALIVALKKLKEAAGKPIVIEELGLPTGGLERGVPWYLNEEQVGIYYVAWLTAAAEAGAYTMPWCGFDYDNMTSPYGKDSYQNFWGMYDITYRLKATGEVFRDFSLDDVRYIKRMLYGLPAIEKIKRSVLHVDSYKAE